MGLKMASSGPDQLFFFFNIKKNYSFMRDRQRHRQREKQAPCKKSDAGLDPRTPGSQPELKADAQALSHPGAPVRIILTTFLLLAVQGSRDT